MNAALVFVDANLPMYAAGAEHAHKRPAARYLARVAAGDVAAVTDAEVFQEILHRYRAIDRLDAGLAIYDEFRRIVPVVLPVTIEVVDDARALLGATTAVSSRDALHAAVMRRAGIRRIASYDRGFDRIAHLRRIEPR